MDTEWPGLNKLDGKFLFKYVHMYIAFPLFVRMSKKLFAICWNSVLPQHFFPCVSVGAILVLRSAAFTLSSMVFCST